MDQSLEFLSLKKLQLKSGIHGLVQVDYCLISEGAYCQKLSKGFYTPINKPL